MLDLFQMNAILLNFLFKNCNIFHKNAEQQKLFPTLIIIRNTKLSNCKSSQKQ